MRKNIAARLARKSRSRSGQGMTEYIIIVVLVAIALILSVGIFGDSVSEKFEGSQERIDSDLDTSGESE